MRKFLEALLTPQLESLWSKRRILEVYLAIAEMGPGVYGAEAASQVYFDKPARALGRRAAALLAAVLPNPLERSVVRPSPQVTRRASRIMRACRTDQAADRLPARTPVTHSAHTQSIRGSASIARPVPRY